MSRKNKINGLSTTPLANSIAQLLQYAEARKRADEFFSQKGWDLEYMPPVGQTYQPISFHADTRPTQNWLPPVNQHYPFMGVKPDDTRPTVDNAPSVEQNLFFSSLSETINKILQQQGYSPAAPVQFPTINNAPPVGQSGNIEPLPFFKYQPPVGQNTINFNPRNPDPRITIDEAPPVYQNPPSNNYEDDEFENILMALRNYKGY